MPVTATAQYHKHSLRSGMLIGEIRICSFRAYISRSWICTCIDNAFAQDPQFAPLSLSLSYSRRLSHEEYPPYRSLPVMPVSVSVSVTVTVSVSASASFLVSHDLILYPHRPLPSSPLCLCIPVSYSAAYLQ